MIPLTLTVEGLYSYQEKQTIDFTQLTAAGIFGIFGNVGSGKSALLEAISYALYGETERLSKQDSRSYNMMNLKSESLLIDFEFQAGDEQFYRATVEGKRDKETYAEVKALRRRTYRKKGAEWEPIKTNELEAAVGLSYDNFRRTVIIPQGKFQEFLQLSQKDRTEMLKAIFKLDDYDLSAKVGALAKENQIHVSNLEGRKQELGEVSEESIQTAEKELEAARLALKDKEKELEGLEKQLAQGEELKALFQKKTEAKAALEALATERPAIESLTRQLNLVEAADRDFRDLLLDLDGKQAELATLAAKIGQKELRWREGKEQEEQWQTELAAWKPEYEKVGQWEEESRDLQELIAIREEQKALKNEQELVNKVSEKYTQQDQERATLEKTIAAERDRLDALAKTQPDPDLLRQLGEWYQKGGQLAKDITTRKEEFTQSQLESQQIRTTLNQVLTTDAKLVPENAKVLPWDTLKAHLEEKHEKGLVFIQESREKVSTLEVKAKLGEYAENLANGEPCPLCGSPDHPTPSKHDHVGPELAKQKEWVRMGEEKVERIRQLQNKLKEHFLLLHREAGTLNEKQKRVEAAIAAQAEHLTQFPGEGGPDNAAYQALLDKAKTLRTQLESGQTALRAQEVKLEEMRKQLERHRSNLENLRNKIGKAEARIESHRTRLIRLREADFLATSLFDLQSKAKDLSTQTETVRRRYEERESELQKLQLELAPLEGELKSERRQMEEGQQTLSQLKKRLQDRLEASQFNTESEVREVLKTKMDPAQSRQRIEEFEKQFAEASTRLKDLEQQTTDRTFDPETHQTLLENTTHLRTQRNAENRAIGEKEGELKKLRTNFVQLTAYNKELAALEKRADNLATLAKLFRGKGFVNYISSIYLEELCARANVRFQTLTRNKLELQVTPDNTFNVVDHLNNGQTRSVKTLSGGQTFQAALSLALALADSIPKFSAADRNFFFLDEGFGTLDKDALQVVFETLKALRKENRVVGVISHVEDLQQEIDVYLKITNDEERGSLVKRSWT